MAGLYRGKVQDNSEITYVQNKKFPNSSEKVYPNPKVSNNNLLKNPYNTISEPIAKAGERPARITHDYWGNIASYSSELMVVNVTNNNLLKNPNNTLTETAPEKKVLSHQQIKDINNKVLPNFMLRNKGITELAMKFLLLISDKRVKLITIGLMKLLVTRRSDHVFLEQDKQKLLDALSIYDQSMTQARSIHQSFGDDETRLTEGLYPIVTSYEQQISLLFKKLMETQNLLDLDGLVTQQLAELATLSNGLTRIFEQNNMISPSSTLSTQQIIEAGNVDPRFTITQTPKSGQPVDVFVVNGLPVRVKRPQAGGIWVPPANNEDDLENLARLGLDVKGWASKLSSAVQLPSWFPTSVKSYEESFQDKWERPQQPTPTGPVDERVEISESSMDFGKSLKLNLAELLYKVSQIKGMPIFTNMLGDGQRLKFLNASKTIHGDGLTILQRAWRRDPTKPNEQVFEIELQYTLDNISTYVSYLDEIINGLSPILDIDADNIQITVKNSMQKEIRRTRQQNLIISGIVKSPEQLLSGIEGLSREQLAASIRQQTEQQRRDDESKDERRVQRALLRNQEQLLENIEGLSSLQLTKLSATEKSLMGLEGLSKEQLVELVRARDERLAKSTEIKQKRSKKDEPFFHGDIPNSYVINVIDLLRENDMDVSTSPANFWSRFDSRFKLKFASSRGTDALIYKTIKDALKERLDASELKGKIRTGWFSEKNIYSLLSDIGIQIGFGKKSRKKKSKKVKTSRKTKQDILNILNS